MLSWVKHHFQHLKQWKDYAEKIAKAAKDYLPDAEVYVIGGVAEDRTTIYSDVDILILVKSRVVDSNFKKGLRVEIVLRAIEIYGLPWDAPVDIHIADENSFKDYLRYCSRMVRIA